MRPTHGKGRSGARAHMHRLEEVLRVDAQGEDAADEELREIDVGKDDRADAQALDEVKHGRWDVHPTHVVLRDHSAGQHRGGRQPPAQPYIVPVSERQHVAGGAETPPGVPSLP